MLTGCSVRVWYAKKLRTMSRKILIIDDDPRNIFALAADLKAKGFPCVSTLSVKEGVELLKRDEGIKIVLLDMMLPDGYEALGVIRNNPAIAARHVIAVTTQAMVGNKEKCLTAGANDYIVKPIDVDKLLSVMNAYLSND
jgi:two-component system cell cycle response regulator DivK